MNDVLDRLHTSHLQIVGSNSIQDSMEKAREMFIDQDRSSAMFYDATTTSYTADLNNNVVANNPRIASSNPKWITVECHYQTNNVTKDSATAWIDYILNRDACKRNSVDRCNNKFVKDWLRCILSLLGQQGEEQEEQQEQEQEEEKQQEQQQQQIIGSNTNNNNIQIQIWRWGCKHSSLKGKGVSGVGVMISTLSSSSSTSSSVGCEDLELCLTRLY